jgi:hypothetical protein
MDAVPLPPLTLAYDGLPLDSDIRHEHSPGLVRITIPAGEPSATALKQAKQGALIDATWISLGFMMLGSVLLLVFIRGNRIDGIESIIAWVSFGVLCAACVLLIASAFYISRRTDLIASRQQMSVIAATPERLLIETTGPLGTMSEDLPAETIRLIHLKQGSWKDRKRREYTMRYLRVYCTDGTMIDILPGRDRSELLSIARAIAAMTGAEVRPA